MDWKKKLTAGIGLAIMALAAFGIIKADEGTVLTEHADKLVEAAMGLTAAIVAIIDRKKKGEGGEEKKGA